MQIYYDHISNESELLEVIDIFKIDTKNLNQCQVIFASGYFEDTGSLRILFCRDFTFYELYCYYRTWDYNNYDVDTLWYPRKIEISSLPELFDRNKGPTSFGKIETNINLFQQNPLQFPIITT